MVVAYIYLGFALYTVQHVWLEPCYREKGSGRSGLSITLLLIHRTDKAWYSGFGGAVMHAKSMLLSSELLEGSGGNYPVVNSYSPWLEFLRFPRSLFCGEWSFFSVRAVKWSVSNFLTVCVYLVTCTRKQEPTTLFVALVYSTEAERLCEELWMGSRRHSTPSARIIVMERVRPA